MSERPPLRSAIAELAWPAVPTARGALLLALLEQFEASQWWPAERLRQAQFAQLARLVAHARRSVPFYAERLAAAGIEPDRPLDPERWRALPVLTRAQLQDAGAALNSRDLPKSHGAQTRVSSSGSTGRPVTVVSTELAALFWNAITLRDHLWQTRDFAAPLAAIRKAGTERPRYPEGVVREGWGPPVDLLFRSGRAALLSIDTPLAQQVEWLQRQKPAYLLTYPSNLRGLAEHCAARGLRLDGLRQLRTMAEALDPQVRTLAEETFGVPVCDMYSAQEVGYIALQAPGGTHYLVQAESVFVEVLRDDGTPCDTGEAGRVVVTPLANFATPLLRYEIGDYAEPGPPSPCGRGLPVLTRILGRARNMLLLRDGGRFWPSFGSRGFTAIAPIRQHQVVQHDFDALEVRLVVERPLTPGEEAGLREHILSRLPSGLRISFSYHAEIPRSAGGKFEDFVSRVDSQASGRTATTAT